MELHECLEHVERGKLIGGSHPTEAEPSSRT